MGQKDAPAILAHFRGLVRRVVTCRSWRTRQRTIPSRFTKSLPPSVSLPTPPPTSRPPSRLQKVEPAPLRIPICGSLYLAGHVLACRTASAQMN
jgi:hypothetical protein